MIGAVAVGFAVNRLEGVPRTLPVLQAILIIAFLIAARVGYRLLHARRMAARSAASHGFADAEEVLVVGVNALSDLFIRAVLDLAGGSIKVNGVLTLKQKDMLGRRLGSHQIFGTLQDAQAVIARLKIHGIIIQRLVIAVDRASLSSADQAMLTRLQEAEGIQLDYFADRLGLVARPVRQAKREDEQARQMRADYVSRTGLYRYGKRLFDFVLAGFLLLLLWPLIVLVAAIVWLDVGRPLLFWQQRPGQAGRPIRVFKFRTMRAAHNEDGAILADVQRLSRVGATLRLRRLDELPQLFNILIGDMSFVGPRPLLPIDQPLDQRHRLIAKPGLTVGPR